MEAVDSRVKLEVGVLITNAPTSPKAQDVAPLCGSDVHLRVSHVSTVHVFLNPKLSAKFSLINLHA